MSISPFKFLFFFTAVSYIKCCLPNQYYDASLNRCVLCSDHCLACIGLSSNCTTCLSGYFLLNSTCSECHSSCASCSSFSVCNNCRQGYYLSNSTCLACGRHCMSCNKTQCITCYAGYQIAKDCFSCSVQYYYDIALDICDICQTGCLKCVNKLTCQICDQSKNYVLSFNNSCLQAANATNGSRNGVSNFSESSNLSIFLIVAGVLGGIVFVSVVGCVIYSCRQKKLKKRRVKKEQKKIVMQQQANREKMEKQIEVELQNQVCIVCKKSEAEIANGCGHFFHKICYSQHSNKCPYCSQDFSVDETHFNGDVEACQSDLFSNVSKADLYKKQIDQNMPHLQSSFSKS